MYFKLIKLFKFPITSLKVSYALVFALNEEMIVSKALNPNFMREEILTVKIAAPTSRLNYITLPAQPRALKNFL